MKKKTNTLSAIVFFALAFSGVLRVAYFIKDFKDSLKANTDLPPEETTKGEKLWKSTYPDDPAKNQDEWSRHISRELNKHLN